MLKTVDNTWLWSVSGLRAASSSRLFTALRRVFESIISGADSCGSQTLTRGTL